MYRVVGCRECGALWIVADRPETTGCPRCGRRHRFEALHAFAETPDEDAARQARSALLADRAGHAAAGDEFEALGVGQLDAIGVDPEMALDAAGIDVEAVAEAGEVARPSTPGGNRAVVLAALEALDRPTETDVIDYATDLDVSPEAVPDLLERLVRAGEVTETGGRYRLV